MSILLNALKKSEAQRQLGQTPGIHTPLDLPAESSVSPPQWVPLSMLALSAFSIAWFVWNQYREPLMKQTAETMVTSPVQERAEVSAAGPAEVAVDRTPVESFQAEKTASPAEGSQEAKARKQELNESFSSFEETEKPVTETEISDAPAEESASLEKIAEALAETRQAPPPAKPAEQQSSPMEPAEPEPISFWQVPQTVREGLPEFRVSVLVYADAPEDRFLVINGVRLVEKGELSDGCVLEEIRRDGAVFTYKKYRFLVKG